MLAHDTYCSTVHNIQAMETTQMLYNGWMDVQRSVSSCCPLLRELLFFIVTKHNASDS
jgi:hypothetical protein